MCCTFIPNLYNCRTYSVQPYINNKYTHTHIHVYITTAEIDIKSVKKSQNYECRKS